jgi:hypothetical chaperone protein
LGRHIGLDFGTTNSSLAVVDNDTSSGKHSVVKVAQFASPQGFTESFRSILYFPPAVRGAPRPARRAFAGPVAIARYLEDEHKGRLIQSVKSFAANRTFTSTVIGGRPYTFENLVGIIVKELMTEAEAELGHLGDTVTVGRPVRFAGADTPEDEAFGIQRLTAALHACGIKHVEFEFEPVGAAYFYESTLDHEEVVLVADFGGGTSDFSLVRVGPRSRVELTPEQRIIGNAGLPLAGDTFDAAIVRNLVSPQLGAGTDYRSMEKLLPIPAWIYLNLERWHYASFLKAPDTMRLLKSLVTQAVEPERITALIHLVEEDLGYQLHRAVQATKVALSSEEKARFVFQQSDIKIDKLVSRSSFEKWIARHLDAIANTVDELFVSCEMTPAEVVRVFLTGGSAFVPAVREIFAQRFGVKKLIGGSEFTSVAKGLALRAAEAADRQLVR